MKRSIIALLAAALLATACGSSGSTADDSADSASAESVTTEAAATETTEAESVETEAAFPVEIEHKFGTTTIEAEPQRVVSIGFNEHDFLLALGVVPVGLREWYGDQPNGVWPWAQDALGDATPEVLPASDLNFEQIAALDPDVIVGVWSGMSDSDYELLSAIAPTVAQPAEYDDFGTPWQDQTLILGQAVGRQDEAETIVASLEGRFEEVRADHPDWDGLFASVAFVTETGPGAYTSQDTRSRIMTDLGFTIPEVNDSGGEGSFYLELSAEDITPLDVDVLVWVVGAFEATDAILNDLPTRQTLNVVAEGREIFADLELTGAFSHASPLSLSFVLDELVPEIEAAADGDPATPVPSAIEVGAVEGGEGEGEAAEAGASGDFGVEEEAAAAAWSAVFDSTVPFAEKADHLEDAAELEATIEAYASAGEALGGIDLAPTAVAISADEASVTYDVNFGGNPAYTDQAGSISLVDGTWTVSRDEFCSFMSSARVGCP